MKSKEKNYEKLEKSIYPFVQKWLEKERTCFKTAQNIGLKHSRADVVGVKDIGGDLTGDIEITVVEVKKGNEPFATSAGQAFGYTIYANKVYLADKREEEFDLDEIHIASYLGIGLIQISSKNKCREILSSRVYTPIKKFNMLMLERMGLVKCQFCESFFESGDIDNKYSKVSRENIDKALESEKGTMFWNREVAERKNKKGIRVTKDGTTFERRFVCPDCVSFIFSQFSKA